MVYGNMIKFHQIISTLMNLASLEWAKDKSANVFAKFLQIDSKMRYNIELKISIPRSYRFDIKSLQEIFVNKKLDLPFFIKYKDYLHKYDFGIMICSFLVSEWEGSIKLKEENEQMISKHWFLKPFSHNILTIWAQKPSFARPSKFFKRYDVWEYLAETREEAKPCCQKERQQPK